MINQRFKIIKKIGKGRSEVFLCEDIELIKTLFALKILKPDVSEAEKQNFRNEFFILRKLEHPNIIRAEEFGTVLVSENEEVPRGSLFFTLEYFPSTELLQSQSIRNENFIKEITRQICAALYYLHQSNYIYYDLKPENILVRVEGDNVRVKLIDLGLAEYSPPEIVENIRGTSQYIAPELLKKEVHNFRVDLYSLGMLLYRVIYNRFPFSCVNELDIYKAHLEDVIEFPPVENYSNELIELIKKLLNKNPEERAANALEILEIFDLGINEYFCKDFLPVKTFYGRDDFVNILNTYLRDRISSEIFTVKGFDNSGKTSLLNYMNETVNSSIILNNLKGRPGNEVIKSILRKIFYCEPVYNNLSAQDADTVFKMIISEEQVSSAELINIISKINPDSVLVLLIDDYNLLDEFTIEIFNTIIPVLQIKGVKLIITENADADYMSTELNNVRELSLSPFTDVQLSEYINGAFHKSFPRSELYELILNYSDLLPGNVTSFIKDLIILKILKFSSEKIIFSTDENVLKILEGSHDLIYNSRLSTLDEKTLNTVKILSCFDIMPDQKIICRISESEITDFNQMVSALRFNNILQRYISGNILQFTSEGLKSHIYDLIENKQEQHSKIAEFLVHHFPDFNQTELAKQYELAARFENSYRIYMQLYRNAEESSSYSYMRKILLHLMQLPLPDELKTSLIVKLAEINYKLSDYKKSIETIQKLQTELLPAESSRKIKFILGSSLLGAGEYSEGKKCLEELYLTINSNGERNKVLTELAYAEFELGNYQEASAQARKIIEFDSLDYELKGKCFNLIGMNEIYNNNNLDEALKWFGNAKVNYEKANIPRRVAGMEVNIGNIYNILGKNDEAIKHWNAASELNQSIGNFEQEGILQLNVGVFYFDHNQPEKSIELYNHALKIFLSVGNYQNQGLSLFNLGEVYLFLCEYQHSFSALNEAYTIFHNRKIYDEECECLFLLGKLFYRIGVTSELSDVINKSKKIIEIGKLSGKHLTNLKLLQVYFKDKVNEQVEIDELIMINKEYFEAENNTNFLETSFLVIEQLLSIKNYNDAFRYLHNKELIDYCSHNVIFVAIREYYLGRLSLEFSSDNLLPSMEYFEKAYELVKEESISEITWKILVALAEAYLQRGNYQKAKQYVSYSSELIQFIADNIETPRLRKSFLDREDVNQALQYPEEIYNN